MHFAHSLTVNNIIPSKRFSWQRKYIMEALIQAAFCVLSCPLNSTKQQFKKIFQLRKLYLQSEAGALKLLLFSCCKNEVGRSPSERCRAASSCSFRFLSASVQFSSSSNFRIYVPEHLLVSQSFTDNFTACPLYAFACCSNGLLFAAREKYFCPNASLPIYITNH